MRFLVGTPPKSAIGTPHTCSFMKCVFWWVLLQKVQLVYHIHVVLWIALCSVRVRSPPKAPNCRSKPCRWPPGLGMKATDTADPENHNFWGSKIEFPNWSFVSVWKVWKKLFVAGTKVLFVRMTFCPTRANYRKDIFMMKGSWTYSWSMKLGKNRHLLC